MSEEYLSTPADASYYPITILEVLVQPGWTIPGKQRLARYRRADGTESGLIFPHACQVQRVLITPGQVLERRTQFMEVRRLDDVATAEPKAAPASPPDPTPGVEAASTAATAAPPQKPRRSAMRWLIGVPLALVVLLWALEAARIWPWHPTWYALKQAITGHPDFEGYYDWASEYYGTETSRDATAQASAAAPTEAPAPQDTAQTDVARIMATMSDEMIWEADAVCDDDTPDYFGYQLFMDYGLTSEDEIDAFCSAVWDAALALVRDTGTTQGTAPAPQPSAQAATPPALPDIPELTCFSPSGTPVEMLRCAYGYGLELAEIGTAHPSLMSETDALRRRAGEKLVWEMEIWFRNGGPSIDMCQHIAAPQVTKSTAASTLVLNRYVDEVYACFRGYHEGIERKVRRNMEVEYVTFDPGILGVDVKALMERMAEETLEYRDSAHGHLNNARSRKLDYIKNRYSAWDWD